MSYVYIRSEDELWTVGFYDPAGKWQPESDHGKENDAADRVSYLNGGSKPQLKPDNIRQVNLSWQKDGRTAVEYEFNGLVSFWLYDDGECRPSTIHVLERGSAAELRASSERMIAACDYMERIRKGDEP